VVIASTPSDAPPLLAAESESLLSAFIRTVSHDLRSPLLTLSLSTELLADALPDDERSRVALDAMRHGIVDLERLLDAVTAVSRARSRILQTEPARLADILHGHIVISPDEGAPRACVAVDPRGVTEAIAALTSAPAELRLDLRRDAVEVSLALPAGIADLEGAPLVALLASLQQYAGTPVAVLAASQTLLERQRGALHCEAGRAVFTLPLAAAAGTL
jgi:signal transduction histidine kinase